MDNSFLTGNAGRFAQITSALCRAVGACLVRGRMDLGMILQVWARLRRVERLMLALTAWIQNARQAVGQPVPASSHTGMAETSAARMDHFLATKPGGAIREFAWLRPFAPREAEAGVLVPVDGDATGAAGQAGRTRGDAGVGWGLNGGVADRAGGRIRRANQIGARRRNGQTCLVSFSDCIAAYRGTR